MNKIFFHIVIISFIGIIIFLSCKKETSCEGCRDGNKPPIANAGRDTTIVLPIDSVMLDGTASSGADSEIVSYNWAKFSGPSSFNI